MKAKISVTEQLAIIRLAKANIQNYEMDIRLTGLCSHLEEALNELIGDQEEFAYDYLREFIPLFTQENAIKHAHARSDYAFWWELNKENIANRVLFLDWMENELLS